MKDKIIDFHPIKGYITFNDLINDLSAILDDYTFLEELIIGILKLNNFDNETILLIFDNDIKSRLYNIIYILKDRL